MGDSIKNYMKTILYADVLVCILNSFMERTRYEGYVRFFSGFLLLTCLLQPLLHIAAWADHPDAAGIMDFLAGGVWQAEDSDWPDKTEEMRDQYRKHLEEQIMKAGDAYGLEIRRVTVQLEEESQRIRTLTLEISGEENQGNAKMETFTEILSSYYQVDRIQLEYAED